MNGTGLVERVEVINGTVTSFEVGRGYGFVAEGGGLELFAQSGDIYGHVSGLFSLGQRVRFEVFQGRSGPQVVAVRKF